jgi:RNA polymerase sigma-70 factor (ECF subfamily)
VVHDYNRKTEAGQLPIEELVARLRDSPKEESSVYCEEIIRRFEPLLRATWRRLITPSPNLVTVVTDYQDFVQDVFVRLFKSLHLLDNPKAFPGFFRQIVVTVFLGYIRKYYPKGLVSTKDFVQMDETTQLVAKIDEQILTGVMIQSYLEQLSEREQEVLLLDYLQGQSSTEIAAKLGITAGAVRTAKTRALNKLRVIAVREAKAVERALKK